MMVVVHRFGERWSVCLVTGFVAGATAIGSLAACAPTFTDTAHATFVVTNRCDYTLEIGLSQNHKPIRGVNFFDALDPGQNYARSSLDHEGSFTVLATGPTGEERSFTVPFNEDNSDVSLDIAGSDCPK